MAKLARPNFLEPIEGPELVIGLVGPIGTDMALVSSVLSEMLDQVNYETINIRVTDVFGDLGYDFKLNESPLDKRYNSYIRAGNILRSKTKRPDILALLSVAAIRTHRRSLTGDRARPAKNCVYILNQFKRPEEIETLRRVYGRGFIQVSAYCSTDIRLDSLTRRISESYYRSKPEEYYRGKAQDLVVKDANEEEEKFGQRVRNTFPLADVVINAKNKQSIEQTCERFVRSFFGDNFVTPTRDEYGAFAAKNASLRSADLSRQVGAVAISPNGEIVATGCNEVPKANGGSYWEGDPQDARDFTLGYDPSNKAKMELLQDILRRLKDEKWLNEELQKKEISELIDEAMKPNRKALRDSHLMDILEFGRIVHAEMSVICDAARTNVSLRGTTLYTTTFPCHICARHIVSAGIARVVFVEPYAKSLAAELYPDSISVDGIVQHDGPKVNFESFVGIAPERYSEIFTKGKRKNDDGSARTWRPEKSKPILSRLVAAYLDIEAAVLSELEPLLESSGLNPEVKTKQSKKTLKTTE